MKQAIDLEKTIFLHLMDCNVPESAIRIVRAQTSDIVTVTVQASHGTKVRVYSAFQLLNGQFYVVDEMVSIADWYHGGSIPQQESWWQRQTVYERFIWLWLVGFTLIVILSIAKHFGLYK